MSIVLKRSQEQFCPPECVYGCCTEVYGKNVKFLRRQAKRASNQKFRRQLRDGDMDD